MIRNLLLSGFIALPLAAPTWSQTAARPQAAQPQPAQPVPTIPQLPQGSVAGGVAQPAGDPLVLALQAAARRDWTAAHMLIAPVGGVAADIIEWQRLRAGEGTLTDYENFLGRRPDWPGLAQLRNRGETAVARSITPSRVIAWFDGRNPATAAGLMALLRAERGAGQAEAAAKRLRAAWADVTLKPLEQAELLELAGSDLGPKDHQARLDNLLWEGRLAEARQMLPLVSEGWQKLAAARMALREDADGVDGLISAVPADLAADPGLAFARFDWRAKKGRREGALEILAERTASAETLGRPAAWAARRGVFARALLREGQVKAAYDLAASHHLGRGAAKADLEFLAGFIALRRLNDPTRALGHFEELAASVSTPISVSRADYWLGRTLKVLGRQPEAEAALQRAARHQTAYYGLLAAEELGLAMEQTLVQPPPLADWRRAGFLASPVTEAALLLYKAGDAPQARRFLLHLAEGLGAAELAAMGAFAMAQNDPHLAVLIGKQAAGRGIILPGIYFPDPAILPPDLAVDRPLALAIARRESEFRADAVSPAGALGLMQLMPGTAKLMADKAGLAVDVSALTSDPGYNARLGSAYLAHLADEFGSSIALRAAGYNAGPGRPRAWLRDLGDPRQPGVDVIDWVEMVPFEETRTYIMRVTEGVAIYGARNRATSGEQAAAPVKITPLLRGL